MTQNEIQQPPKIPEPKGWFWVSLPISRAKAVFIFIFLLYVSLCVSHANSMAYPFDPDAFSVTFVVAAPLSLIAFSVLFIISSSVFSIFYKWKFKSYPSKKAYLVEFVLVILMIFFLLGDIIHSNIDRPRKTLRYCLMEDAPLPASIGSIEYHYWHSMFGGTSKGWVFEIDPADFEKLLKERKYVLKTNDAGFDLEKDHQLSRALNKLNLPESKMVYRYSFPDVESEQFNELYTHILTDETRSKVIVLQYYVR